MCGAIVRMTTPTKSQWSPWIWIKWKAQTPSTAWEMWQSHPKIMGAWSTHGEWDCCLWVDAASPDELEEFVWKTIRKNEWVDQTKTMWAKKWW